MAGGVVDDSVDSYDVDTGIVAVTHMGKGVGVDVSLLVEDLRFTRGDWLNIVGYLEQLATQEAGREWLVRGVMVWPVSPGFNIAQYEKVVLSRMENIS